jgi:ComF family protein
VSIAQVYQTSARAAVAGLRVGSCSLVRIGYWLAPAHCLLCNSATSEAGIDLCRQCAADLPTAPDFHAVLQPAAAVFSPWRYDYPVDRLVRGLKFHGDRGVARALGGQFARWRAMRPEPLPDLLVPVPLHIARLRQRGYNQADEIARYVATVLLMRRIPLALERVRDTPAQSGLPAALRGSNLVGAFRVPAKMRPLLCGARVALMDDVMTTGNTARAAAAALLDAQVQRVELWTLARVT